MNDLEKRTRRNLWMFPIGTVGRDMLYQLFNSFILTYTLFTRQLTNAQLGAITAIMVAARIFDALNDPIMGNIIERTRTKWGKYKPWLVIGILSTSVVVYLSFNVKLEGWPFVWFFGLMYFAYSITFTMHDISYWGMIPSLGSDGSTRDRFTSRATLFAGVGGTLAGILIPMFTTGEGALGGSAQSAYGLIALIFSILGPVLLLFTIAGAREDRSYMNEAAPPISLKMILKTILGNDQLVWISIIFLLQQVGNGIILGGVGSTYIYLTFGYEGGLYSTFNTIGMAATAVLMVFYPTISSRIRRKALMKLMMIVGTAGYAIMLLGGLLMPNTTLKFWVITLSYMITSLGQYAFYLIMMISIINTVEYNEYKTGARDEAVISSLRPFLTKMGSALVAALTSLSYVIFRVTDVTNQISVAERDVSRGILTEAEKLSQINTVLGQVSDFQAKGLILVMSVLPFILMAASYFLYQKYYTLDEDEYSRIVRILEEKKTR